MHRAFVWHSWGAGIINNKEKKRREGGGVTKEKAKEDKRVEGWREWEENLKQNIRWHGGLGSNRVTELKNKKRLKRSYRPQRGTQKPKWLDLEDLLLSLAYMLLRTKLRIVPAILRAANGDFTITFGQHCAFNWQMIFFSEFEIFKCVTHLYDLPQ